jgi:hypothetical protein
MNDSVNGILTIAMAGTNPISTDATLVNVTFYALKPTGSSITTPLTVGSFFANESDLTTNSTSGSITITDYATGIPGAEKVTGFMSAVYPNPSTGSAMLKYHVNANNIPVNIEIWNLLGQKVSTLANTIMDKGDHSVSVSDNGRPLSCGTYFIRMTMDGLSQSQMFQVVK